jgi:hypothetical protein
LAIVIGLSSRWLEFGHPPEPELAALPESEIFLFPLTPWFPHEAFHFCKALVPQFWSTLSALV